MPEVNGMLVNEVTDARGGGLFTFAEKFGSAKPLSRILSLARINDVKTLTCEQEPLADACKRDFEIDKRIGRSCDRQRFRISLFSSVFKSKSELSEIDEASFLGYLIVNIDEIQSGAYAYVSESVISSSVDSRDHILTGQERTVRILGARDFSVKGSYFCQQDGFHNCCAHACVKMSIENLPAYKGKRISYHDINDFLKNRYQPDDLQNQNMDYESRFPYEGLQVHEIAAFFESIGLKPIVFDFDAKGTEKPVSFGTILYHCIESNWPAIIGFASEEEGHVISVTGHQFDSCAWLPEARRAYFNLGDLKYFQSVFWTNSFKIHDDNYGPYYNLPTDYFSDNKNNTVIIALQSAEGIGNGHIIEVLGFDECVTLLKKLLDEGKKFSPWGHRALKCISRGEAILRTKNISKTAYLKHIQERDVFARNEAILDMVKDTLPENIWLTEVSIPELFSANQQKIGEFVVNPNKEYGELIELLWLSGLVYFHRQQQSLAVPGETYEPLLRSDLFA